LADAAVGEVHMLKIDAEGFEFQVLRGAAATVSQQPLICMEVTAALTHDGDPLAAHDLIMAAGAYRSFNFRRGKGRASPLVEITDRGRLAAQVDDNVVYIPQHLINSLPAGLFA
jgi:hypothetical protein